MRAAKAHEKKTKQENSFFDHILRIKIGGSWSYCYSDVIHVIHNKLQKYYFPDKIKSIKVFLTLIQRYVQLWLRKKTLEFFRITFMHNLVHPFKNIIYRWFRKVITVSTICRPVRFSCNCCWSAI